MAKKTKPKNLPRIVGMTRKSVGFGAYPEVKEEIRKIAARNEVSVSALVNWHLLTDLRLGAFEQRVVEKKKKRRGPS